VSAAVTAVDRPTLVVFSHLRWDFVLQRPQQLMLRLARWWRVVFIEEPMRAAAPHLDMHEVAPNVLRVVPHTTVDAPGFHDAQIAELRTLLRPVLGRGAQVCWLFTPMALPLIDALDGACVVYDCMDELSAFKDAPRQLRQRESALLRRADLVLTGGPSLYEKRRGVHPHLYCVPSSVDASHYAPAGLDPLGDEARAVAELQGHLPRPRLGFFGVIDERMDLVLLDRIAAARPQWSLAMVGPVVKIDAASLPQRPNIHWLGLQPYARLPYFLAGWDVALMPFARNEATRFISPTKTLEYLAGECPVVSTAIADVIGLYGHAVDVVRGDAHAFVQACDAVLAQTPRQRDQRLHTMLATVATQSWEHSVQSVHTLLQAACERVRNLRDLEPPVAPLVAVAGA
jgi:glycosyltransferase involved in cell wall biosynthesis